jgi:beta-galactosidase
MEHSTSAVNWQPRNLAKQPGQLARNSLQHVARGADAVCFFQWRASRAGAEKFHSGMVPHAGTDTKVWREVVELGKHLKTLGEVAGSRVRADVAILFDWNAWWAVELDSHPSTDVRYLTVVRDYYEALWNQGVTVDFARPDDDLSAYKLVVVPALYLVSDKAAAGIADYVRTGGHLLCTFFSGIVDDNDAVRLGGYPGAFRDLLGVRVEEFFPLSAGEVVTISASGHQVSGSVWTEALHAEGADVDATYVDGPLAGWPALTRHRRGDGVARYVTSRLDTDSLARLVARCCEEAGVRAPIITAAGVEAVRRHGEDADYVFVINQTQREAEVRLVGDELLTGHAVTGSLRVPAGGVAVVREVVGSKNAGKSETHEK